INAMANLRRSSKERKAAATDRNTNGAYAARRDRTGIHRVPELRAWACPLPTIDAQIVLRSARALHYGASFQYGHYAQIKSFTTLAVGLAGVGAVVGLAQLPPTRALLEKVRGTGEGPSAEVREKGWFKATFLADADGKKLCTLISGGDPGYNETA